MPFTLTMPKMSPTMEEGAIAKWHKKVGDYVEAGDLLIEVATDKATVEFNALDAGWLRKIIVPENGEATVNQPIAIFSEEENESIEDVNATPAPTIVKVAPAAAPAEVVVSEPVQKKGDQGTRVAASPLAKKLAKAQGIDLTGIQGTGPNQRVMSRDLTASKPVTRETVEEALTPMRKVISQRLQEAKATIPHFYLRQAVDIENLLNMREQLKHSHIAVTINDLIVKACALALAKHPNVNSGFNAAKNSILRFGSIDISVAVTVNGGLITPIVKGADQLNVTEISRQIKDLSSRAKAGKLQEHEYKGGSFTVSNLGMFGITEFAAIINPPQAAILAVAGIQEVPVVKNGQIVPGKVVNLTLSADHRVVDGVAGAEFLQSLKKILENPIILMI